MKFKIDIDTDQDFDRAFEAAVDEFLWAPMTEVQEYLSATDAAFSTSDGTLRAGFLRELKLANIGAVSRVNAALEAVYWPSTSTVWVVGESNSTCKWLNALTENGSAEPKALPLAWGRPTTCRPRQYVYHLSWPTFSGAFEAWSVFGTARCLEDDATIFERAELLRTRGVSPVVSALATSGDGEEAEARKYVMD